MNNKTTIVCIRLKDHELAWLRKMGTGSGYTCISDWLRYQIWHEAQKRGWTDKEHIPLKSTQSEWRNGRPRRKDPSTEPSLGSILELTDEPKL